MFRNLSHIAHTLAVALVVGTYSVLTINLITTLLGDPQLNSRLTILLTPSILFELLTSVWLYMTPGYHLKKCLWYGYGVGITGAMLALWLMTDTYGASLVALEVLMLLTSGAALGVAYIVSVTGIGIGFLCSIATSAARNK